jgi:hypothetical protein
MSDVAPVGFTAILSSFRLLNFEKYPMGLKSGFSRILARAQSRGRYRRLDDGLGRRGIPRTGEGFGGRRLRKIDQDAASSILRVEMNSTISKTLPESELVGNPCSRMELENCDSD